MKLSVSLMACDLLKLEEQVETLVALGERQLHLDLMDGYYVGNVGFGTQLVSTLREKTGCILDLHLMVENPARYILPYLAHRPDIVTFHIDTVYSVAQNMELIALLRTNGIAPGIVAQCEQDISCYDPYLALVDVALVLGSPIGRGGQGLAADTVERIAYLAQQRETHGYAYRIEVDGGIDESTIGACVAAGAEMVVSGSAVFKDAMIAENIERLHRAARSR